MVIRQGRVKITTSSPHGDELVLTVLGPGDVLGEVSLLEGGDITVVDARALSAFAGS